MRPGLASHSVSVRCGYLADEIAYIQNICDLMNAIRNRVCGLLFVAEDFTGNVAL